MFISLMVVYLIMPPKPKLKNRIAVNVILTQELLEATKSYASVAGKSVSEVVREALEAYLAGGKSVGEASKV